MKYVPTFKEYISENALTDTWNKIVEFFSSSVQNTIRKVKKSDSKKEKEKLLNKEIEKQAKEYVKLVKKDDEVFTLMEVTDDLFKMFELYKSITGKKHDRHVWRSEYLGGTFVWPELLKVKSEDEIVKHYNKKIEDLGKSTQNKIKGLEKEREQFTNLLKQRNLSESFTVESNIEMKYVPTFKEFVNEKYSHLNEARKIKVPKRIKSKKDIGKYFYGFDKKKVEDKWGKNSTSVQQAANNKYYWVKYVSKGLGDGYIETREAKGDPDKGFKF